MKPWRHLNGTSKHPNGTSKHPNGTRMEFWHGTRIMRMCVVSATRDQNNKKARDGSMARDQNNVTEFRQPLQVQSHLEMPRILVQLGHTQRTQKLAPQTDPKWSPTWSLTRF